MQIEKGTIVFDLDETLVHCTIHNVHLFDHQITVIAENGIEVPVGVNIRPHAISCLTELSKHFELIMFTAGHYSYADRVIDIIDPNGMLFACRLFRNSCIQTTNGFYIKDLRILNRDLSKLMFVDNSILSFAFQLDNGVPIVSFYDDQSDCVLPKLKEYLLSLCETEDYRVGNVDKFGLRYLHDLNVQKLIKYYLYFSKQQFSKKNNESSLAKKRKAPLLNEPPILKKVKEND
jgi:CTD small phosphatase-like protein 2